MRAKFVNEKFIQDSDPIADMNIGVIYKLKPLDVLYCKEGILARTRNNFFHIEIGYWCVIKEINMFKNKINLELATYNMYPKPLKQHDLPFIGGEFLSLTPEEFFEHFTIKNVKYKKEGI